MTDFSVTRIDRTPDKIYMGGDEAAPKNGENP
jgi:hypothetical protein